MNIKHLSNTLAPANLPRSTFCTDPRATHTVDTADPDFGYGIYGYYTNEFDAHRVKRWLKQQNCAVAVVVAYDPKAEVTPGIHPFIRLI